VPVEAAGDTAMLSRRHLIALAAGPALAPAVFVRASRAQPAKADFPSKPVRVIVPVAAGGPTDIVARMLAEKLSRMWDQQVVVENKGGAGTNIGNEYAARSDPDGYTILFATASLAVNISLYRSLSYDPLADFTPVSLVTELPYFVFVPNSSPAHSIRGLIEHARADPGRLTMASPGTGSAPFLAEMLFLQMADIRMTHVPYRGANPAFADLIPGRVDCYFGSGALLSYSRSGQVRVLASSGPKRDAAAPEVPTIAEAGVPGYEAGTWTGVIAPAGLPRPIVDKLNAAINKSLTMPNFKARFAQIGDEPAGGTPEEFAKVIAADSAKWKDVVIRSGAKFE
jgi:tripartite-type tricarboxylate transporter receptor subunit TctC